MSMSSRTSKNWDLSDVPPPWGDRPSIYEHVRAHLSAGPEGLTAGGESLPDEEGIWSQSQDRQVADELDSPFGTWAPDEARTSASILGLLKRAAHAASEANVRKLYDSVAATSGTDDYIYPFRHLLQDDTTVDRDRVRALAQWFARGAADREVVKWALATLGVVSRDEVDLLLTLGRHEEFTEYAVDAARHSVSDPDQVIWELARHVTGWHRAYAISRLAGASDQAIKGWMLREGFESLIMIEYAAYTLATTGGLLDALSREQIDDDLLKGAGRILQALITANASWVRGMSDYAEGAAAVEAYLGHMLRSAGNLQEFLVVDDIRRFCGEALAGYGWSPERRARIERAALGFLARDHWKTLAMAGLSQDSAEFETAVPVAQALGIDTWDHQFRRLVAGEDQWYGVMQTDDPQRVERVIPLALERIPIATAPAGELGVEPAFPHDLNLFLIVQELRRFPGKGLALVHAALRSAGIGHRNVALRALAAWGESRWGPQTRALLEGARNIEPVDEVRERMGKLLSGELTD